MSNWLGDLLRSGKLHELARGCRTEAELARKCGRSPDAYTLAKRRLVRAGTPVPGIIELRFGVDTRPMPTAYQEPAPIEETDFESEERTQPSELSEPSTPDSVEETITVVEEHRLKQRVRELEAERRDLIAQLSDGGEYHEVIAEVLAKQHEAPAAAIEPRERTSGTREGTALILASDWHIEEEVLPEQVAGRNRYNLEISAQRMERFFEGSMSVIQHQRERFKIRDCVAWLGGDFITNFLHDDNIETNLLHPTEAILYAQRSMISGIDYWLQDPEIERFTIPCNDGNHGRLTEDLRAGTRTQNSLEVFLYAQLAHHYRNEPRVRFVLPTSAFTFLDNVYGRTIRFTHGDTFRYAGGVGGLFVPLMRVLARWETVKRADLTCLGHWHQRICLPSVMVNGSLIGYSSYAMSGGFPFEAPAQSLRMLDSLRWCGEDVPIWVSDRLDDDQATGVAA
jgi:hypothetical protein